MKGLFSWSSRNLNASPPVPHPKQWKYCPFGIHRETWVPLLVQRAKRLMMAVEGDTLPGDLPNIGLLPPSIKLLKSGTFIARRLLPRIG